MSDWRAMLRSEAEVLSAPCGDGRIVVRHWRRRPPSYSTDLTAAPRREPVVLVHGGSGSWTHWLRTIPALFPLTDVYAVDLPGLGDSDMPDPPLTPEHCGEIVADAIEPGGNLPAGSRPRLVGFSFGAHVSTHAAIRLGDRISDFTIVGSSALGLPHPPDMAAFPKERRGMSAAELSEIHRRTLEILMIADPARIDDEAIALQAENIAKARFRSREFARSDQIKQRLADVHVPVNAIWGERDVLAYPSLDAVRAALAIHQPGLTWRTVPDAGHWVMYEQAEAFNRTLIEVLALA